MNRDLQILVILLYTTVPSAIHAQETYKYSPDRKALKFRDGVYTNIEMVKKNRPIPSTWIVTDKEVTDRDFYKEITKADKIVFFDDNGIITVLDTKSVWGFCHLGDLHINVGGAFHKLDIVGSVSHFFASRTTNYPNPFVGGYYTGDFWATQPLVVTARNGSYIVDMVENKVRRFDMEGLESLLKRDPPLWNDFISLEKRDKEYLKYIFLDRYNKKYPLDIPFD